MKSFQVGKGITPVVQILSRGTVMNCRLQFALCFQTSRSYLPYSGLTWHRAVQSVNGNGTSEKRVSTFSLSLEIPGSCQGEQGVCFSHSSPLLRDLWLWRLELLGYHWTLLRGEGSFFWPPDLPSPLSLSPGTQLCLPSGIVRQGSGPLSVTWQLLCSMCPPLTH